MKLLLLILFFPFATTGPVVCGTGSDSGATGTAWTNPGNVTANDNSDATVTVSGIGSSTHKLIASNFNFSSLPQGATILTINIEFEATSTLSSANIQPGYKHPDGSFSQGLGGVQLSDGTTRTLYNRMIDPSVDPGIEMVTAGELKNSNFGIYLEYLSTSGSSASIAIDYVQLTVTYTVGGGFFQLMSSSQ